jgi:hypothetical protein
MENAHSGPFGTNAMSRSSGTAARPREEREQPRKSEKV